MRLTWAQTKHCKRVVFTRRHEIIYRRNKGGCCALPVIFFSAVRALCKLLQGRWNNWLAYLFISSDCWQPTSPGDLAYRQQVKQTGNYCVTFNPGCRSIVDPRLRVFLASFLFFFLKTSFLSISAWSVILYFSCVSASWSVPCHHFPKSFAYLSWNLNLCTTWKIKCGAMRRMLSGRVRRHNIRRCQMHYVQDISHVTTSCVLFSF